jgi:hypothetical protein
VLHSFAAFPLSVAYPCLPGVLHQRTIGDLCFGAILGAVFATKPAQEEKKQIHADRPARFVNLRLEEADRFGAHQGGRSWGGRLELGAPPLECLRRSKCLPDFASPFLVFLVFRGGPFCLIFLLPFFCQATLDRCCSMPFSVSSLATGHPPLATRHSQIAPCIPHRPIAHLTLAIARKLVQDDGRRDMDDLPKRL